MIWNLDAKDLSFLGGAASTLVAAFSYWFKTRHERRRATRAVQYYLLEIHHHVRRTHESLRETPPRYLELTQAALGQKGILLSAEDMAGLTVHLDRVLRQFTSAEIHGLLSEFAAPLEKALADLSREDPILAFMIRGGERLMLLTKKLEALTSAASSEVQNEAKLIIEELGFFDELARETTLQQLRAAIRAAAWRCDLFTLFRTIRILKASAQKAPDEDEELRKFVDDMVNSFASSTRLGLQPAAAQNSK